MEIRDDDINNTRGSTGENIALNDQAKKRLITFTDDSNQQSNTTRYSGQNHESTTIEGSSMNNTQTKLVIIKEQYSPLNEQINLQKKDSEPAPVN